MNNDFQETLEPLNLAYAETFVNAVEPLARVQHAMGYLPPQLKALLVGQDERFLYGAITVVQALYDLMGMEVLTLAGNVLDPELKAASKAETPEDKLLEQTMLAEQMAQVAASLVGIAEALGVVSCKELLERAQED